jgi:hypothetical protein
VSLVVVNVPALVHVTSLKVPYWARPVVPETYNAAPSEAVFFRLASGSFEPFRFHSQSKNGQNESPNHQKSVFSAFFHFFPILTNAKRQFSSYIRWLLSGCAG